jgi:hypothetical protein
MPSEHERIQQELITDMLEQLANTPLMRETSAGVTINETQRVFWAINFIDKFAKARGLEGLSDAIYEDQERQKQG